MARRIQNRYCARYKGNEFVTQNLTNFLRLNGKNKLGFDEHNRTVLHVCILLNEKCFALPQ